MIHVLRFDGHTQCDLLIEGFGLEVQENYLTPEQAHQIQPEDTDDVCYVCLSKIRYQF